MTVTVNQIVSHLEKMPEKFQALGSKDCESALAALENLRSHWLQRNPVLPFYTLGAASYIDAAVSRERYLMLAKDYNAILATHFDWLYRKVFEIISEYLQEPLCLHPNAAHPGFHIYLSHPTFEKPIASTHCDTQYNLIDWQSYNKPEFEHSLSFTLPLALPNQGGGLNLWNIHYQNIKDMQPLEINQYVSNTPMEYCSYHIGELVVHSGHILHQAAPGIKISPDDRRITLQGHCTRVDNCWYVYW